jgi:uncharacterized protein Usg
VLLARTGGNRRDIRQHAISTGVIGIGTLPATINAGSGTHDQMRSAMRDIERRLIGYRLTTAEILYHMPDHPSVLQSFIWQDLDLVPGFPVLNRFLQFWQSSIDGRLHSVRVAARGIITDAEMRLVGGEFVMN